MKGIRKSKYFYTAVPISLPKPPLRLHNLLYQRQVLNLNLLLLFLLPKPIPLERNHYPIRTIVKAIEVDNIKFRRIIVLGY